MTAEDKTHLNPRWTGKTRALTVMREPAWERQPGERAKDFAAFQAYRDLPPSKRSIRRVAQTDRRTKATLEGISSRWRWVERALQHDDDRDRVRRQAQAEAVQEMGERHGRQAKAILNLLMQPANVLAQKLAVPEGQQALQGMGTAELMRLVLSAGKVFTDVMRAERLARGEADVQVGVQETGAGAAARAIMRDPEAVDHVHAALRAARAGRAVVVDVVGGATGRQLQDHGEDAPASPPALESGSPASNGAHRENGAEQSPRDRGAGEARGDVREGRREDDPEGDLGFLNGSGR